MNTISTKNLASDAFSSLVVCCVAIPMCMGIAILSNAEPFSGAISGIIGGILVGLLSGSQTSITGPSAGLTLIIGTQLALLGSFETLLLALAIAGVIQMLFGIFRLGWLAYFFPSSVLQALLAAIGAILVLKQIPHLLGHDTDPEGDMSFLQPDRNTTISELGTLIYGDVHLGSMTIGLLTLALLVWLRYRASDRTFGIPGALIAIALGIAMSMGFKYFGPSWAIESKHLVQIPLLESMQSLASVFHFPNWAQWNNPKVYVAAISIALASSLESLLNVSATDKFDLDQRYTPTTRELFSLGCGNMLAGLIGGIPMSSAIERSAVSLEAGAKSKWATVLHGTILAIAFFLFPQFFNLIPLSVLAAVLIVTGFQLASPERFLQVWRDGRYQFIPFVITFMAILFTDLIIGALVGLCVGIIFILNSNLRRPLRRVLEKHIGGEILHIELGNQVSFLNRPVLEKALREAPEGASILLDARNTDYIDPDILAMIRDFKRKASESEKFQLNLRGFRDKYLIEDDVQFIDYTSRELQEQLTPDETLRILQEGNERFCSDKRLSRDLGKQLQATSVGQHPFAAVLGCIDSRAPIETILDLGLGDVFSVRVAGNITGAKIFGSLEYATAVVGSKLILVLGHTKCGAVTASVKLASSNTPIHEATGCQHLSFVLDEIRPSIDLQTYNRFSPAQESEKTEFIEQVARRNVIRSVHRIVSESTTIRDLVEKGRVAVVGAIYDVSTGKIDFLVDHAIGLRQSGTTNLISTG